MLLGTEDYYHVADDHLLREESDHRVRNEIAAAVAALRLASAAEGAPRDALLSRALARLEGFGAVHAALGGRVPPFVDLKAELTAICHALVAGRSCGGQVALALEDMVVPGGTARRVLMVAAELVANSIRHALAIKGGLMSVSLRPYDGGGVLEVADDGPGMVPGAPTSGTGLGQRIVHELVGRAGGHLEVDGDVGLRVRVFFPVPRVRAGIDA